MHFPGFNVGAGAKESAHEVNMEVCCVPGFQVLQWLLPHHTHIPAVFFLLMKLMLGQHTRELPDDIQVGVLLLSCSPAMISLCNLFPQHG